MLRAYWTLVLDGQAPYAVYAERYVFYWPLYSSSRMAPRYCCLRFHRGYIFLAALLLQFVAGSIYAISSVAGPINAYFRFPEDSSNAPNAIFLTGILAVLAQALLGPLVERKGPRKSLAISTCVMAVGLLTGQIATVLRIWPLLPIGTSLGGMAFAAIVLASISTALKWAPDARGTVAGICLFGFGLGKHLWGLLFEALLDGTDATFQYLFWILLAVLLSTLLLATLIIRLPPKDFSVRGHDMHCIPCAKAPNTSLVQDEFLHVGMTLVNYKAIARHSNSLVEGTDRQYHEQVKAMSLLQCIFSTDFACLLLALTSNSVVGLFYNEMTATQVHSNLLSDVYHISDAAADAVRFRGVVADLSGRLVIPILSDICIRLLYGNPALVRKGCFLVLLLVQCVALPLVYFTSNQMTDVASVERLLYLLQFVSNSGASLLVCFLADMFGVYHVGTMYGLSSLLWAISQGILLAFAVDSTSEIGRQVLLFWYLSLLGFGFMLLVRTNSSDRFYRGYQFTMCGKVLVRRPWRRTHDVHTMDFYADVPDMNQGRASMPYLWSSSSSLGSWEETYAAK
ncbi:hypothetical protein SPRG_08436 [Saprolegnia parasitica CBS 223.65]|uniref:Major facilitator superfamily (MFS) profile domain-containing protein n=1 Tax=Saprolegnia parasitica (strain CBS 223.65) TaxID=695850 RepID=A0A067CA68_SAPPC|nr:hypothetical protein SPRG_08436 [Saprolegnia parasitica CBS 223.65]KDO26075.1 hypothetical protein SPRG_08436 [Saprolegnia parasitica CBS 223.65]|eukprot:XP_012203071.1 hypothetical protein SPRG_08436 [Saprolegnia parasitica CBS 223.65]